MTSAEHASRFAGALLGGAADLRGLYATLWEWPAHVTHWIPADEPDDVASRAVQLAGRKARAVYVGVGLSSRVGDGSKQRPKAKPSREPNEETGLLDVPVTGLLGVAVDIDIAGPGHDDKQNYPATMDDARRILGAMHAEPSIEVDSGGGLQAWWLFPEPWVFGQTGVALDGTPIIDPERYAVEHKRAIDLMWSWVTTMRLHARFMGSWHVDPTGDIARLLRVPGTLNNKLDQPRPVVLTAERAVRYDPEDLWQWCADPKVLDNYRYSAGDGPETEGVLAGVDVHGVWARVHSPLYAGAKFMPPWLAQLIELDTELGGRIGATFNGRRNDLGDDQNVIDASLARQLADIDASPEQIIEAIMCRRLRCGVKVAKVDPGKRVDYLARTVGRFLRTSQERRRERAERQAAAADAVDRAAEIADVEHAEVAADQPVALPVEPAAVPRPELVAPAPAAPIVPGPLDEHGDPDVERQPVPAAAVDKPTKAVREWLAQLTGFLSLPTDYTIARAEYRQGATRDEIRLWVHRGPDGLAPPGRSDWAVNSIAPTRWRPKSAWEKPGEVTSHLRHDLHLMCGSPEKNWSSVGLPLLYGVLREVRVGTPKSAVRAAVRDLLLRFPPVTSFAEARDNSGSWLASNDPGVPPTVAVLLSTLRRHLGLLGDASALTPEQIVTVAAASGCAIRDGLVVEESFRTVRDSRTWIVVASGMLDDADWAAVRQAVADRESPGNVRHIRGA